MPVGVMILPKDRPLGKPLFHWGVNYFPPAVEVQIRSCRQLLKEKIQLIQEHKAFMRALFFEAIGQIEFFGLLTRSISEGENPLCRGENLQSFQSYYQGFSLLDTIQDSSPRTYELFKQIETKNIQMLQAVRYVLQKASASQVKAFPLGTFQIDVTIEPFRTAKYADVPLAQALVQLVNFQNLHLQAWQEMMLDLQWQTPPQKWPEQMVNVSTGGIAVRLPKRFPKLAHVYTKLYFPRIGVLEFEGSVVMQKSIPTEGKERIAVNFDFPTQDQQIALRTQMELFELQKAVEVFG